MPKLSDFTRDRLVYGDDCNPVVDGTRTDLLSGEKVSGATELPRCGGRALR